MNTLTRMTFSPLFALLLVACGGGATDAKSPDDSAAADSATDKKAADADKATETKAEAEPAKEESASNEPQVRSIVTSESVAFVFDFVASEVGTTTEEKCRKSAGEDNKKFADCRRKIQEKLGVLVLQFKEKDGKWWWTTHDRRGSELKLLHKVAFTFGEETKDSLTIIPEGKDVGPKPAPVPDKLVIKVPDANTIEIDDPKLGKTVYRAKIGIVEEGKPVE